MGKKEKQCAKEIVSSFGYSDSNKTVDEISDEFKRVISHPKYQNQFAMVVEQTCEKIYGDKEFAKRSKKTMNKLGHSGKLEDICIPLLPDKKKK